MNNKLSISIYCTCTIIVYDENTTVAVAPSRIRRHRPYLKLICLSLLLLLLYSCLSSRTKGENVITDRPRDDGLVGGWSCRRNRYRVGFRVNGADVIAGPSSRNATGRALPTEHRNKYETDGDNNSKTFNIHAGDGGPGVTRGRRFQPVAIHPPDEADPIIIIIDTGACTKNGGERFFENRP